MTVEKFFELFMEELKTNANLQTYYKFLSSNRKYLFRKNYFIRRLEYLITHAGDKSNYIWDLGCGYGTLSIFLALNGYKVHATTLEEFYISDIEKRLQFWSQYGDLKGITISYEDLFEVHNPQLSVDRIIMQDTLHHIEPISEALPKIMIYLKAKGKIIVIEENGGNLLKRAKLFLRRGNKRIIKMYDERLKKEILMGNENVRSLNKWDEIFKHDGLTIQDVQYIQFYPPVFWRNDSYNKIADHEDALWKKSKFVSDYFYWGVNFTASRVCP